METTATKLSKETLFANDTFVALVYRVKEIGKMPNIRKISQMLTDLGIEHIFEDKTYQPTKAIKGTRLLKITGKKKNGFELHIKGTKISLDTTCSYYSINTWINAKNIVDYLFSLCQ